MVPYGNTRSLPTRATCSSGYNNAQCLPSTQIIIRVALGEMGLKTGGKSAVGTDEATAAAVMDWHIQPSPVHSMLCSIMTGLIT